VEGGLMIPVGFEETLQLDAYVAWANRSKAPQLGTELEEQIADLWGQPVRVRTEGHLTYPPPNAGMALGIFLNVPITAMLAIGITLVPNLLFEEKQTKTMDALLVSPSSIGQVVSGKALAGLFYMLVAGGVVLAINWEGIVHWTPAVLFVISTGLFVTALGLVLGSLFERQQEVTGWTTLLILTFTGAMFVQMMDLQIPPFWRNVLPWVPSVALIDVLQLAFVQSVPWARVWANLGSVLGLSVLLYAVVVWKVRRSDR
jgi:ABC-2 type transport system permease protein